MLAGTKVFFTAFREGLHLLRSKDPLILSSSTAFFATFSLSPIVVILVTIFGLYAATEGVSNHVFRTIASTFGPEASREVAKIVENFLEIESTWWMTVAGTVFLLFVSTTLLTVIKFSIQRIWNIRTKRSLHWRYHSKARATQVAFILFTGLLFGASLLVDTSLGISLDYLQSVLPGIAIWIIRALSFLFSLIVITAWFTVLFKVLPEANLTWDTAMTGGFFTSALFFLGKYVLGKILVHARLETVFGASASFALLLLFIFYCSFILYYGAAFTYAYGEGENARICATRFGEEYEERIIESSRAELS